MIHTKQNTLHKVLPLKNKTKIYVLLAVVLGIWGTIGYKLINGMSPDIAKVNEENFDLSFNPKTNTEIDTFSIKDTERDPFLGTLSRKKINRTASTKSSKKLIKDNRVIIYGGLIKKQNSSDYVFIVNINKNQYLLKKGQTADSVKLIKGNEKGITIRYHNKNKTIKRQ